MQITDPIADMLTRVRNAGNAKHETVDVPASKMKKAIAEIMLNEGYIKNYQVIDDGTQGVIRITLKYLPRQGKGHPGPAPCQQARPARLRRRRRAAPRPQGPGHRYHSTSKGVMTDKQARKEQMSAAKSLRSSGKEVAECLE